MYSQVRLRLVTPVCAVVLFTYAYLYNVGRQSAEPTAFCKNCGCAKIFAWWDSGNKHYRRIGFVDEKMEFHGYETAKVLEADPCDAGMVTAVDNVDYQVYQCQATDECTAVVGNDVGADPSSPGKPLPGVTFKKNTCK